MLHHKYSYNIFVAYAYVNSCLDSYAQRINEDFTCPPLTLSALFPGDRVSHRTRILLGFFSRAISSHYPCASPLSAILLLQLHRASLSIVLVLGMKFRVFILVQALRFTGPFPQSLLIFLILLFLN